MKIKCLSEKKKWKIWENFRDGSLRLRYFIYLHPLSNSFTISRIYPLPFLSFIVRKKFRKKFCLLSVVQRREISPSSGYGWIRVNNRKTRKRCKESLRNSISQVAANCSQCRALTVIPQCFINVGVYPIIPLCARYPIPQFVLLFENNCN